MNKKTAKALEASIKHWEENLKATVLDEISVQGEDCALCMLHLGPSCGDCIINQATGESGCDDSPYMEAVKIHDNILNFDNWTGWKKACKAEIKFLKGLRE